VKNVKVGVRGFSHILYLFHSRALFHSAHSAGWNRLSSQGDTKGQVKNSEVAS